MGLRVVRAQWVDPFLAATYKRAQLQPSFRSLLLTTQCVERINTHKYLAYGF